MSHATQLLSYCLLRIKRVSCFSPLHPARGRARWSKRRSTSKVSRVRLTFLLSVPSLLSLFLSHPFSSGVVFLQGHMFCFTGICLWVKISANCGPAALGSARSLSVYQWQASPRGRLSSRYSAVQYMLVLTVPHTVRHPCSESPPATLFGGSVFGFAELPQSVQSGSPRDRQLENRFCSWHLGTRDLTCIFSCR